MKIWLTFVLVLVPSYAIVAAGGVAEGFDAKSWIARWPVVTIVVASVVTTTAFILSRTANDPPPLKWSAVMFSKTEDQNGYEETQAGRDCYDAAAG